MRHNFLIALAVLGVASSCFPAIAQSQGRVSAGVTLWTHDTNLEVEHAADFDGSNITAQERAKDWDVLGSGAGVQVGYEFARQVMLYGEGGITQATIRDKDVADPDQNVASQGLDDGAYFALGARVGGDFSSTGKAFWAMNATLSGVSTALDQDINTSWDYDETKVALDGKVGAWFQRVGVYGGLRFVHSSADLSETDLTNAPGQQTRTTELGRDGAIDLLVGVQTKGSDVAGFTEIGLVGTFSANAGLALRF